MSAARRTQIQNAQGCLLLLFHNHQPPLVTPGKKTQIEPYARFHAMRAYRDMPRMVEDAGIKASFNLTPTLLEQLQLYLLGGTDVYLEHTRVKAENLTNQQKQFLLDNFFKTNEEFSIKPYDRYAQLLAKKNRRAGIADFTTQEYRDLQVWFNLQMFGYRLRQGSTRVRALIAKDRGFTEQEKQEVIAIQLRVIREVLDQYKKLQDKGRIAVTVSPYSHPILPLLINQQVALEGLPGAHLPQFSHPDDARAHLHLAGKIYQRFFGRPPLGMWPSEGSVSMDTLALLSQTLPTIKYILTDADIRAKSLPTIAEQDWWQYFLPWSSNGQHIFFRNRSLADDIGFVEMERYIETAYEISKNVWRTIDNASKVADGKKPVVPIVLDGENLQPSRRNDAVDFLRLLFRHFADSDKVVTVLPEEYLELYPGSPRLERLFPGSWIASDFSTWTGDYRDSQYGLGYQRTHRADNMLEALHTAMAVRFTPEQRLEAFDQLGRFASGCNLFANHDELTPLARAQLLLLQAQSSCFRWWFAGRQGEAADLGAFDLQYRSLVRAACDVLGVDPVDNLDQPFYYDRPWAASLPTV